MGVSVEDGLVWEVINHHGSIHVIPKSEGMRHYFKVLKDRGYNYSAHYAPHDIQNRSLMNDGKSRLDIAKEGYEIDGAKYSVRFQVVPNIGIMDGIEEAAKKALDQQKKLKLPNGYVEKVERVGDLDFQ